MRFIVLTNLLQGCATWIAMITLYILFREEHFLFARLGGLTGIIGGLSVALKQCALSNGLTLPLVDSLRDPGAAQFASQCMAHAPLLALAWAAVVLLCTHSGPPDELLFAANGILFGWAYLRYYQPREAGMFGDPSEGFAFARLFPAPVQPPLRAIGEATFVLVSMCGCFPPAGWASLRAEGNLAHVPVAPPSLTDLLQSPLPTPAAVTTTDPEIAERRRERARALIEARLAQKVAADAGSASEVSTPLPASASASNSATTAPWTPFSTPGSVDVVTPHIATPTVSRTGVEDAV